MKPARKPAQVGELAGAGGDDHVALPQAVARRAAAAGDRLDQHARRRPTGAARSGSSANVAPARRGSSSAPASARGCSRRRRARPAAACRRAARPGSTGCRPAAGPRSCAAHRGSSMRSPLAATTTSPGAARRRPRPMPANTRVTSAPRASVQAQRPAPAARPRPAFPARACRGAPRRWRPAGCITSRARLVGMAKPRPMLPAIAAARVEAGGVDADQLAVEVDQRAAGVARVDRGIGLDEVLVAQPAQAAAADRRDDARGHRLADAERVADRDHEVAHAQLRRNRPAASRCRSRAGIRITAMSVSGSEPTNSAFSVRPSAERHRHLVGAFDHVVVGQHVARRAASTITPEPSDSLIRSWVSSGNMRRNNGSSPNGCSRARAAWCAR